MKNFLFCFVLIFIFSFSYAHKFAKYNIVIDSDCGIDDFRAISYFLASKDFNINAITCVDGVLSPENAADKISKILSLYHHEGIPVAIGKNRNASKKYSSHANKFWEKFLNNNNKNKEYKSAVEVLFNAINNSKNQSIIVAMGPLSNIYDLFKKYPEITGKISYILWISEYENNCFKGYNFEEDTIAFNYIQKLAFPLKILSANNYKTTADFFSNDCQKLKTKYSQNIAKFFSNNKGEKNYFLYDDFLPLYIIFPQQFQEKNINPFLSLIRLKENIPYENLILNILNSEKKDAGVVFNEIPINGYFLNKDIANIVDTLIDLYGYDEYKLIALTSEIHSHLGIYSILGAKMGLRIMEYLHVGLDEIKIESCAGSLPPISCLNDGLQIASGATMGYGAFSLNTSSKVFPEAIIFYNNRKIRIKIKNEIFNSIANEIFNITNQYGYNSEMYWIVLRNQAIDFWKNANRFDIFDIIEE